jgi:hypothetical protein
VPSPTPRPAVTAEFLNGLNHAERVSGLTVTVDGVLLDGRTGSDGCTGSPVQNGARVQTSGREDYIDRDTRFLSTAPRVPLWFVEGRWNLEYFHTLVYQYSGGHPDDTTWDYLWCPAPGVRTVSVSDDIRSDSEALLQVNVAVSEANRVAHGYLTLRWADPGTTGDYHFKVDPADTAMGRAYGIFRMRTNAQGYMSGGTIVMRSLAAATLPNIAVHELGHGLGLQHSPYTTDVMCVGRWASLDTNEFSEGEEMAVVNLVQRKPGNRFPDSDPPVAGAALAGPPADIVCGLGAPF